MTTELDTRALKVAVVDDNNGFAKGTLPILKRIDGVEARSAGVEELVAWGAEIIVIDVRAGARLLIPPLRERGIDVIVAAGRPVVSVIEGCPVYDKERSSTALVALVEAIRRRRTSAD